jgi:heat shock protein HslJ
MRTVVAVALLAAGVSAAGAQALDPALTSPTWHVVEVEGERATHAETLQISDGRIAGKAACNRFAAGFKHTGSLVEIGQPVATRMFCQGRMEAEKRYLDALHATQSYVLGDGSLVLNAADGHAVVKLAK